MLRFGPCQIKCRSLLFVGAMRSTTQQYASSSSSSSSSPSEGSQEKYLHGRAPLRLKDGSQSIHYGDRCIVKEVDDYQQRRCAIHGTFRMVKTMREVRPGIWECPGTGPTSCVTDVTQVMCSRHGGYVRLKKFMSESTPGVFTCKDGDECKVKAVCSKHMRERQQADMVEISPGVWECSESKMCGAPMEWQFCSIHGKKRKQRYLIQSGDKWECSRRDPCRDEEGNNMVTPKEQCSLHGMFRSRYFLQETPQGLWQCKGRSPCSLHEERNQVPDDWVRAPDWGKKQ